MTAATYIVRVQNVKACQLTILLCDSRIASRREKLRTAFIVKTFFLRKSITFFHNLIPYSDHCRQIVLIVFSNLHLTPPIPVANAVNQLALDICDNPCLIFTPKSQAKQDKAWCLSKWLSGTRRAYPPHIKRPWGAGEVPKRHVSERKTQCRISLSAYPNGFSTRNAHIHRISSDPIVSQYKPRQLIQLPINLPRSKDFGEPYRIIASQAFEHVLLSCRSVLNDIFVDRLHQFSLV